MSIKIRPLRAAVFITVTAIISNFWGLAGQLSQFYAWILPCWAAVSILQLIVSKSAVAFHQHFSNDHPVKGETVKYELSVTNESIIPIADGSCFLAGSSQLTPRALPVFPGHTVKDEQLIHCAYRGIYTAGLTAVIMKTPLGIIETKTSVEPRLFYVYPELVDAAGIIADTAGSSGSAQSSSDTGTEDSSVFDYLVPARDGTPEARFSWKRMAQNIPSSAVCGMSHSPGLSLVLDLYKDDKAPEKERLAAEDIAATAAYSLLRSLAQRSIPSFFYTGIDEAQEINNIEDFKRVFDASTGVIFNEQRMNTSIFSNSTPVFLITVRPLSVFFTQYEDALAAGCEPHVIACCPPYRRLEEQKTFSAVQNIREQYNSTRIFCLADAEKGAEEIVRIFSSRRQR